MKQKNTNLGEKKLQLKKHTIEAFTMQPRHLRMVIGKGIEKEQGPKPTQHETQGGTHNQD